MESQPTTTLLIKQNVCFSATCYGLRAIHHLSNCRKIQTEEYHNDTVFKMKVLRTQHITENIIFSLILICKILTAV